MGGPAALMVLSYEAFRRPPCGKFPFACSDAVRQALLQATAIPGRSRPFSGAPSGRIWTFSSMSWIPGARLNVAQETVVRAPAA
jgi:hypothetical protein